MGVYSHSRLSCFENCPYQYKLKYIDKIRPEIPTSIEAFMGDLVHQTLEKLYKDLKFKKLNSLNSLIKFYRDLWKREYTSDILIAKKDYSAQNYKKMGEKYITDYYNHYKPFDQMTVLGLETQDKMRLSDGNSYHVRIDKLACRGNTYYVCDYKTNSRLKDQSEADADRQLAMYSIWVRKKFTDAKKVVLLWNMLAFNKEVVSERTEKQLDELEKETVSLIKKIERCKKFEPKVSKLCDYCVYQNCCPAFSHKSETDILPPEKFKDDDGVKLVDAYSALYYSKKEMEAEIERLKERIVEFAKQKCLTNVYGSNQKASVKACERVCLPAKQDRSELNAILKEKGLWDEFSDLDSFKMSKAIQTESLNPSVLKMIKKFVEIRESWMVRLGKR